MLKMVKTILLSVVALCFLSAERVSFAVEQEVMRCGPKDVQSKAPTFLVKKTRFSGIQKAIGASEVQPEEGHAFVLTVLSSPASQIVVQKPVKTDHTFILTANHGSMGYAHLYTDGDKTIVDVNHHGLGGVDGVDTQGPQDGYTCQ